MPRVALKNYEAHYQQVGRGPDVVLIHGFTSNMAMWVFSGIADSLKDRFRVTSYDLRGHGVSSAPPTGYTTDCLADDLAELHEALGLQPALVVGHSLGGVVGMHAAVRHSALIAGNILSDTYFPGLAHLEPNMPQADVWTGLRDTFLKVNHDIGPTVDFRRLLDIIGGLGAAEQATLRETLGPPVARWLSQLKPLATTTAAEEVFEAAGLTGEVLRKIQQPVVALYDERTPFEATWRWLGENMPNFAGERVPGAAHLALLESPEVFTQLVRKYLIALTEQPGTPIGRAVVAGARINAMWFSTFLILNLLRRRARSLLTIAGMAIAIGTTVALLGVAENLERSLLQALAERGVDLIVLEHASLDPLASDVPESFCAEIEKVPGVRDVGPGLLELVNYPHKGSEVSMMLQGWLPDNFLFDSDKIKIKAGRRLTNQDKGTIVLGSNLSSVLDKHVGDKMEIQRHEFEVVGIVESFNFQENGLAFLPLHELQQLMGRPDSVTGISVRLDRRDGAEPSIDGVKGEILALADDSGGAVSVDVKPTADFASQSLHIQVTRGMAWATSLIALIVGAVGTLNTMLMSVVERIKEISILRAIGWKRGRVARMVLGECFVLSMVGATIGIAGAALLLLWLSHYPLTKTLIQADMPPIVIVEGLTVAAVVAIFGGGYPAWRATQLTPVEGLSHE